MQLNIWNEDCITGAKQHITDQVVDLIICDPPFGINESKMDQLYKRNKKHIINGYVEAPDNYYEFTKTWMNEAKRVLKKNGSMYIIVGHTPLLDVMLVAKELELNLINHIIWKFNFGAFTKTKFVTSHYHILYLTKKGAKPTFNTNCRFGPQEKDEQEGSLRYQDLEDVFYIKKEYNPNSKKNVNKLPNELIKKLILYSSNKDDTVADFFMGNFTTAYVSLSLGRKVVGFELNKESFDYHHPLLGNIEFGCDIPRDTIIEVPFKQGQPFVEGEKDSIRNDMKLMLSTGLKKKDILIKLTEKYGRGRWSIQRVVDEIK